MVRKLDVNNHFSSWDVDAYKRRLRIMREIISGDNQTEFAKRLGIDFKRWSNYERGYPVPREVAFMLHEKFEGFSIEWLWFGSLTSLSPEYKAKIALAEKLDVEHQRDLAVLDQLKAKIEAQTEQRKKALHPPPPAKQRQKSKSA